MKSCAGDKFHRYFKTNILNKRYEVIKANGKNKISDAVYVAINSDDGQLMAMRFIHELLSANESVSQSRFIEK